MYTIRTVQILIKLLPSILALRKDRKKWINQNKNKVESNQFKKNASKVLETFISLGPVYIKLGQWLSSRADILPQPFQKNYQNFKTVYLLPHLIKLNQ